MLEGAWIDTKKDWKRVYIIYFLREKAIMSIKQAFVKSKS